jgi:glycosyltransferase involved in cell wall biosynthesis
MVRWQSLIHEHLWRSLPRGLRRGSLFHITSCLAPRPTPEAAANAPLIVAGFLQAASGLGEGARLCHEALCQCRQDVYGIDLTEHFRQPGPVVPLPFRDGRSIEGPGTVILHINAPFVPLALMHLGKRFVREKRIIGYWAWELPSAPREWRFGLPYVHEIWVPSRFTAHAIAQLAGEKLVRVVPHPVATRKSSIPVERRKNRPFTALLLFNMASGFARKNPIASIDAFKRAFAHDIRCRLIIRTLNADLYPHGYQALQAAALPAPNVNIVDGGTTGFDVDELYRSADVLLSLHRSEGFGLVIAEAMLHGLPVLATNWSGNVDYLTSDNGMPISYSLVPAIDRQATYDHPSSCWAEANLSDAATKLRILRDKPEIGATLGRRGASDVRSAFGVEAYRGVVEEALTCPPPTVTVP